MSPLFWSFLVLNTTRTLGRLLAGSFFAEAGPTSPYKMVKVLRFCHSLGDDQLFSEPQDIEPEVTSLLLRLPNLVHVQLTYFNTRLTPLTRIAALTERAAGPFRPLQGLAGLVVGKYNFDPRSEEHTSELQSQHLISYAVFCLKKRFF